jgi:hypothetical protein
VGSKQVKMFFDPEYELYVNLDRFIRIGWYSLHAEDFVSGDDDSV